MTTSIPLNWVIAPAGNAVKLLAEETILAALLQRSIGVVAGLRPLLNLARSEFVKRGQSTSGIDFLVQAQDQNEAQAKEYVASDYAPVVRHGIIGMWVAVEVAVEDTATLVLRNDPTALGAVAAEGVKIPSSVSSPMTEEDAARIYARLEKHVRTSLRVGEGYCRVLQILGVAVAPSSAVLDTMSELNYARNIILHRGSVVDARVTSEAPALQLSPGDRLTVSSARYMHYYEGASAFVLNLLQAATDSRHAVVS